MREILEIQRQLLPDLLDVMKKRHTILQHIMVSGTVGRRMLASSLNMTERVLRSEIDFLKEQGLLDIESNGMRLTAGGQQLLQSMEPMIKQMFGLYEKEDRIRNAFGLSQVVIVPGDSDESLYTKKELGRAGAAILRKFLTNGDVVAVTGGSTIALVAANLSTSAPMKGSWFVPARGGLGESVEFQANTIASQMAKKTGAKYKLLHVPDDLGEEAYQTLIQEPTIQEILEILRDCRIVIHGIGDAMVMARRRKVDAQTTASLRSEGALAEAFGYYFDRQGNVIHKMSTLGLRLEDIVQAQLLIGVAGGKSKGEAIVSVLRFGHQHILVTDEAAADEVLRIIDA